MPARLCVESRSFTPSNPNSGHSRSCGPRRPPLLNPPSRVALLSVLRPASSTGSTRLSQMDKPTPDVSFDSSTPDRQVERCGFIRQHTSQYLQKCRGLGKVPPPRRTLWDLFWSFLGAFCGIATIAALTYNALDHSSESFTLIVGSMGATATLVYAAPDSPLAQPRNTIGGSVVSAVVGVAVRVLVLDMACNQAASCKWLVAALAVSLAIVAMIFTETLHPPGGALALIAATADPSIRALGWWYILFPALISSVIMVLIGVILNNFAAARVYPQRWT